MQLPREGSPRILEQALSLRPAKYMHRLWQAIHYAVQPHPSTRHVRSASMRNMPASARPLTSQLLCPRSSAARQHVPSCAHTQAAAPSSSQAHINQPHPTRVVISTKTPGRSNRVPSCDHNPGYQLAQLSSPRRHGANNASETTRCLSSQPPRSTTSSHDTHTATYGWQPATSNHCATNATARRPAAVSSCRRDK